MGEPNRDGLDLAYPWYSAGDMNLTLDGRSYVYSYLPGEYQPQRYGGERQVKSPGVQLSVALAGGFGGSVVIEPQDGWDRVCRALLLCPEFQTGVPDVDAEFMLSGVVSEDLGRVLRLPATHECLRALFNAGFTRVELFEDRLTAICRPWLLSIPTEEPPAEFRQAVAALGQLQDLLASVPASPPSPFARWHHRIASSSPVFYVLASVIAAVVLFLILQLTDFLSAGDVSVKLGEPAFGAGVVTALLVGGLIRRQAFRGKTIAAVLLLVSTVTSFGALDVMAFMNEGLDSSPASRHEMPIRTKWIVSGRRSTSFMIRTASWRSDHSSESFEIPSVIWSEVVPDRSTFLVVTHAGYLGVEWVESENVR